MNRNTSLISQRKSGNGLTLRSGILVVLVCLLTVTCSSMVQATEKLDRIREKTEEMVVAINKVQIAPLSEGKDSKLQNTYGDYAYLLTPKKLDEINGLIEETSDPVEKARRERTAMLLQYHSIRYKVASVLDNCINSFRDNSSSVDGKPFILRGVKHTIGLEQDRDIRRKYSLAAADLYTPFNVYMSSLTSDLNEATASLDYDSYYTFLIDFEGWDIDLMNSTAETVLTGTSDSYTTLINKWAEKETGLILRRMRSYDADHLFFFPSVSTQVDRVKLLDIAKSTLKNFGIDLKKQRTLKIDIKDRTLRDPKALAHPIQPEKGEVTMIPSDQIIDIVDLMGALGESQFHYLIPKNVPFEEALSGTNIGPATFRALFEMVCEEPGWIADNLKVNGSTAEEVAEVFLLRRLYKMRKAVADYQFQLQLQANPRIEPATYNSLMKDILLWKHTKNDAKAYQTSNDNYRSGGLFMGYTLATQIRTALINQLGEDWYKSEEFGTRLRTATQNGLNVSIEEFLGLWGINSFDTSGLNL